jgi:hypothetical protein
MLLLVCIVLPGISLASGVVPDVSFGSVVLKMIVPIAAFFLLIDVVALTGYKKS